MYKYKKNILYIKEMKNRYKANKLFLVILKTHFTT